MSDETKIDESPKLPPIRIVLPRREPAKRGTKSKEKP